MSPIRRYKILNRGAFLAAAVAAMALGPAPAEAAVVSFMTPTGATVGGRPVSARADITTSNQFVQITLFDLQTNPTDASQLLSDFQFTVSGGSLAGSSQVGATAQEITVNSNGTFSLGSTLNTVAGVGWVYTPTATTGTLDVLAGTGHAGPTHTIIGPSGGATYSNANTSIAGNGSNNPFLNQAATFTILAPGVTAATTISAAMFSFGIEAVVNVPGVQRTTAIPEPASFATVGMGSLLGLGYVLRKRKRAVA